MPTSLRNMHDLLDSKRTGSDAQTTPVYAAVGAVVGLRRVAVKAFLYVKRYLVGRNRSCRWRQRLSRGVQAR